MGVLLQGFYALPNLIGVPCPNDGNEGATWWWDYIAQHANALRKAGFSAIWLPPITKANSGIHSIGYDVFDDYDIGAKNQQGTVQTRYGSREQLQRCIAILRANGIDVYLDIVDHQRDGGNNGVYNYIGADGTANTGRFPKVALDFHPNVPNDPNVINPNTNAFGNYVATMTCVPYGYMYNQLIAACDWYTRSLDVQGYRFDDAESVSSTFTFLLATSLSMAGKFVVGEVIDVVGTLSNWVFQGMAGIASVFDYPLHFTLASMCNNPGAWNMAGLNGAGFTTQSPLNSVTFAENHDTDNPSAVANFQPIINNKMLAYAYILTIEGYPSVYYRDYSSDPNCYGLGPFIDNLIWIHEYIANGQTQQCWIDYNVFAYQRLGAPGLLVALNNDPVNAHTITVATNFGPNITLHDYTGHAGDVVTNGSGSVTITIPQNINGASYVCYSPPGATGTFTVAPASVTQQFDGAADLDILPAKNGTTVQIGRIWSAAGSPIKVTLSIDQTDWSPSTRVTIQLIGPDGADIASQAFTSSTAPGTALQANAAATTGFHTLQILAANLPAAISSYTAAVTYSAPTTFTPS